MVAGRWTTNQKLMISNMGHGTYKVAWVEPNGTVCSLDINFRERWLHGFFGLAQWINRAPELSIVHQNLHLKEMRGHRDNGPLYPLLVQFDFAEITFIEDCGRDNDDVINCGPSELPEGYLERKN
jgi:phenolic acid decarboxylase